MYDSESGNENKLIVTLISLLVNLMPSGRGKPIGEYMGFRAADPINQTNAVKRLFLENHKIQHPGHFLGISVVLSSRSEELRPTKRDLEPGSQLAHIAPFPLVSAELLWRLSAETPAVALTQFSVSLVLFPLRKWSLGVVLQRYSRNYTLISYSYSL